LKKLAKETTGETVSKERGLRVSQKGEKSKAGSSLRGTVIGDSVLRRQQKRDMSGLRAGSRLEVQITPAVGVPNEKMRKDLRGLK